jgi:hypothetical protein
MYVVQLNRMMARDVTVQSPLIKARRPAEPSSSMEAKTRPKTKTMMARTQRNISNTSCCLIEKGCGSPAPHNICDVTVFTVKLFRAVPRLLPK